MSDKKWIKLGTLHGEIAEKICNIIDTVGVLRYQERTVEGRMVLDVFTDGDELKRYEEQAKCQN